MYFPKSRKLILTAGLLALSTFSGCSMNRSYLHCPSFARSWRSTKSYASEPQPATEAPIRSNSSAPVAPEVFLEDVPNVTPPDSSKPMGPQIPPKPISVPKPGTFNAPRTDAAELPSVDEFGDERSPGDDYQNFPVPVEVPADELDDVPAETPIPEGLQSSVENPSILKRIQDSIPRIQVRSVRKVPTRAAPVSRSVPSPASRDVSATTPAMTPSPDPISYLPPSRQKQLAQPSDRGNRDKILTDAYSSQLITIPGRGKTRTVSSQDDDSLLGNEQDSEFEFEFDTPPEPVIVPDQWPYRR
ncbi:MAG: hypothetical protein O2955_12480 [Planctomycetota bacterium]|nr:hypothetical protein [Planctomycetota bacterium]MDA1213327.1 hypothetical protein [Planctomycetota bacterium]